MAASTQLKGRSIAVVGAGIAGLAAARELMRLGAEVTIFEKSRGLGGRVATRHAGPLSFDHGAQFATAHRLDFAAFIGNAEIRGQSASWTPRHAHADQAGQLTPTKITETRHVGSPGMNALAKALAGDMPVITERRIVDLERVAGRWSLRFADETRQGGFDHVALAVPAPQALPLVTGIADFATTIASAVYAPCWAVMVAFPTPLALPADAITLDDPALARAARDSSKPGHEGPADCWVLHASPEWSRTHIEETPEIVAATLLERFQTLFGATPDPSHLAAHRWRYALVERNAGVPCLWDSSLGLGACGDWCQGARVEAAFDSGLALAAAIAGG